MVNFRIITKFIILIIFCIALVACTNSFYNGNQKSVVPNNLYFFSKDDIYTLLNKRGIEGIVITDILKSSAGSEVFIHYHKRGDLKRYIAIIGRDLKLKIIEHRWPLLFINGNYETVGWSRSLSKGVEFSDGYSLKLSLNSIFVIDDDGNMFAYGDTHGNVNVSYTNNPAEILFSTNLEVKKIYIKNNDVLLFGINNKQSDGNRSERSIVCQIYNKTEENVWKLSREISIPQPTPRSKGIYVIDVDSCSNLVLIADFHDVPFSARNSWHLFDLKKRKIIGSGKLGGYVLFLTNEIGEILQHKSQ